MRRFLFASVLFFAFGCPRIEPPETEPYVPRLDASVADAKVEDAGLSCTTDNTCPSGQYCNSSNFCVPKPIVCMESSTCALGEVCSGGQCIAHPRACAADETCADPIETCIAAGFCAPGFAENQPLALRCAEPEDCGPAGICTAGVCVTCGVDRDCPGNLTCSFIGCIEQPACAGDDDCYFGNECRLSSCQRSTDDCTPEMFNDDPARGTLLAESYRADASICGDSDLDYYRLSLPAATGARIAITSTRSQATIQARAIDEDGADLPNTATLVLPGLTVIELAGEVGTSTVVLELYSVDTSGDYAIDVRYHPIRCAGDPLDLYGDATRESAVLVPPGDYSFVSCIRDDDWRAIDLSPGDALQVDVIWNNEMSRANIDVEIWDATGTSPIATSTLGASRERLATAPIPAGGRFFVRVYTRSAPTYGVEYSIRIAPQLNDRFDACAAPAIIDLSGGSATLFGTLRGANNLGAADCGPSGIAPERSEMIYQIRPPAPPSVITASVRQIGGTESPISIALLSNCEEDLSLEACSFSRTAYRTPEITVARSSADPVYLMISGGDDADFEIEARVDTPAVNDRCVDRIPINVTSIHNAGTIGATNDAVLTAPSSCGFTGDGGGPDRFYSVSLVGGERAALELTGPEFGFLWIGTSCAMMTATCTVSAVTRVGNAANVALAPAAATDYVVAVDGFREISEGPYQLRVVREPELECLEDSECMSPLRCDDYRCVAIAANDLCTTALPIVLTSSRAVVYGSTGAANENYELECAVSPDQADVVYVVDIPAGVARFVARISEATFDPVLGVRRTGPACETVPDLACNDDEDLDNGVILPRVELVSPAAGPYAIIVDAYQGEGAFTLEVELIP